MLVQVKTQTSEVTLFQTEVPILGQLATTKGLAVYAGR